MPTALQCLFLGFAAGGVLPAFEATLVLCFCVFATHTTFERLACEAGSATQALLFAAACGQLVDPRLAAAVQLASLVHTSTTRTLTTVEAAVLLVATMHIATPRLATGAACLAWSLHASTWWWKWRRRRSRGEEEREEDPLPEAFCVDEPPVNQRKKKKDAVRETGSSPPHPSSS